MAKVNAYETPKGIAIHPWINKPDTKYAPDGVFKMQLKLKLADANVQNLKVLVDEAAQVAFDVETKDLTAGEKKKWTLYVPYTLEEDDEGNETGYIIFTFKRNRIIKLQGGDTKELQVYIYDSKGNVPEAGKEPSIWGGTELKTLFTFRNVKVPGTKNAGVKLDFSAVKVFKLSKGEGKRDPFAKEAPDADGDDDGYVWEPSTDGGGDKGHDHDEDTPF